MKKRWSTIVLSAFLLSGCIAGGGEPYDDRESNYAPNITVNEIVTQNDQYTLIVENIIRKSHDDVGNMVEVLFRYDNETDETLYLTAQTVRFDEVDVNIGTMAFFEELTPKSSGTVIAYFQDIEEQNLLIPPLTHSLFMNVELVVQQSLDVRATYDIDVTF